MPLLSQREVLNLKLSCIPLPQLRMFAQDLCVSNKGKATDIIKRIWESQPGEQIINEFIKKDTVKKFKNEEKLFLMKN